MPAAPASVVSAMYLTDSQSIWTQVSVWDCGNRQTKSRNEIRGDKAGEDE